MGGGDYNIPDALQKRWDDKSSKLDQEHDTPTHSTN